MHGSFPAYEMLQALHLTRSEGEAEGEGEAEDVDHAERRRED